MLLAVVSLWFTASEAPRLIVIVEESSRREAAALAASLGVASPILRVVTSAHDVAARADAELLRGAKQSCAQGRQQATRLETSAAIASYEQALVSLARGGAVIDDGKTLVTCLIDLGAAFVDAGRDADALDAFRRALAVDAAARPLDRDYNPAVVARFAKAEKELRRSARGSISIAGKPTGAEVILDGRAVGQVPISLPDLSPSEHWLFVSSPGYKRFAARIRLAPSKVERIDVFLPPLGLDAAALVLTSTRQAGEIPPETLAAFAQLSLAERGANVVALSAGEGGLVARAFRGASSTLSGALRGESMQALAEELAHAFAPTKSPSAPVVLAPSAPLATRDESAVVHRVAVHPGVSWLPFGIAQLLERRPAAGALLIVSQALLLGANLGFYFAARSYRYPDGTYAEADRARALGLCANIAAGVLAADVLAGVIDGIVHRSP